jgi:hypothetical protein
MVSSTSISMEPTFMLIHTKVRCSSLTILTLRSISRTIILVKGSMFDLKALGWYMDRHKAKEFYLPHKDNRCLLARVNLIS